LLRQIKIQNFALIEDLEISFENGMSCITGETGAGKSILLGGLSLVLGKRADLSSLLDLTKKCIVEASFDIGSYDLETFFERLDLDYDIHTILRREILPQSKSRAFINDTPVTLDLLQKISQKLLDIHSQNDTQTLLEKDYQFEILDALGSCGSQLKSYKDTLIAYKKVLKEYLHWATLKNESQDSLELKNFLFDELSSINLKEGMEDNLESKISLLSNIEYLQTSLSQSIHLLGAESTGIIDSILKVRSLSQGLSKIDSKYLLLNERIQDISIETDDLLNELKIQLDQLEANPQELEILQAQLDQVNTMLQKHKVTSVLDLISVKNKLEDELQETLDIDGKLKALMIDKNTYKKRLEKLAYSISVNRKNAIKVLEIELKELVGKMGMPDATFNIQLNPTPEFLSNGKDLILFQFSANKGGQFNLLKKVASGGELSRIMLAIKYILSRYKKLPTLIFDEIDTGVSGKISDSIADIMKTLSNKLQVLTITHLPQVAAKGNHHFKVQKSMSNGKMVTSLNKLSNDERIEEIAMMLSGNEITPTAIAHAKQLMN
jgi:DNA repair protein RecN (Recombination protein N)